MCAEHTNTQLGDRILITGICCLPAGWYTLFLFHSFSFFLGSHPMDNELNNVYICCYTHKRSAGVKSGCYPDDFKCHTTNMPQSFCCCCCLLFCFQASVQQTYSRHISTLFSSDLHNLSPFLSPFFSPQAHVTSPWCVCVCACVLSHIQIYRTLPKRTTQQTTKWHEEVAVVPTQQQRYSLTHT